MIYIIYIFISVIIALLYAFWPDIEDFWYSWPFEE